jgi:competence protein ComEA
VTVLAFSTARDDPNASKLRAAKTSLARKLELPGIVAENRGMERRIMGAHTQRNKTRKQFAFGRKFYLTQAVVWGLFLFVVSTVSALAPAAPQSAGAAPAPAAAAQSQDSQFPDNPGRATFLRTCSVCHSPTNVLANGLDRDGWADTITKMVGFGATGTDEEFSEILDYLTKSFPPTASVKINVNKSTADQLATGLGVTPQEAKAIVDYRQKNGDFKTIDDLKKVPSIDATKIDLKKSRIAFE